MRSPKKKSASDKVPESDNQNFRPVGIVFLVAGLAMIVSEVTRPTGIPFLILGLTFVAIGQGESSSKPEK